jgi:hypothetical protein
LYAHMNNKRKRKKKRFHLTPIRTAIIKKKKKKFSRIS